MPAKKAASKNRKRAAASRKKAATRKSPPASRKTTGKKRKVSSKKSSKKKVAKKRSAVPKKAARRSTGKKSSRKKAIRKKAPARQTASKKKSKSSKAKKATARKPATRKKSARPAAASPKKAAAGPSARRKAPDTNGKTPATNRRPRRDLLSGPIHGIKPYAAKRGEEYMSPKQLAHFQQILNAWKRELMNEVDRTVHHMQDEAANFPDPNDRATQESEFGLELRTRDRERKLLRKIDSALQRIDDGTYGYCDETGEEIGLKRLEARPVATLCLEAQERREMAERQFRDRDDRYR